MVRSWTARDTDLPGAWKGCVCILDLCDLKERQSKDLMLNEQEQLNEQGEKSH